MTTQSKKRQGFHIPRDTYTTWAAVILFFVLLIGGQLAVGNILNPGTISNLLINNSYLIILAVGMTFAILTGGIDLSVGAVVAFSTVAGVTLIQAGWNSWVVAILMVLMGTIFGLFSGVLIRFFNVQPFIATLSVMFLARGLAGVLTTESLVIPKDSGFLVLATKWTIIDGAKRPDRFYLSPNVLIAIAVVAIAFFLLHRTRFGRTVYAIGGNEQAAELMGLPAQRSKLLVYVVSGTCSGLAGVIYATNVGSVQNFIGTGWELDAIAATVIGGTLLTGGVGYVLGSVVGVLITGILATLITVSSFEIPGVPSGSTAGIITALILLLFVLLQKAITFAGRGGTGAEMASETIEKEQEKERV